MALVSSKIAAGMQILADHFNKLREDLTTNHDHSSGQGGTIDHADLAETGAMSGISKDHSDIDLHIEGSGSITDNPGGTQGVHGLAASAYVAGSLNAQLVIQAGSASLDENGNSEKEITFSVAFSSVVSVVATYGAAWTNIDHPSEASDIYITDVSSTGFTAHTADPDQWGGKLFYWIAMGTK